MASEYDAHEPGTWREAALHFRAENERLTALLAERDAEIARLGEAGRDAIDCLERASGAQRPYSLTRTREIRLALDTLRAALAARGGEVQS